MADDKVTFEVKLTVTVLLRKLKPHPTIRNLTQVTQAMEIVANHISDALKWNLAVQEVIGLTVTPIGGPSEERVGADPGAPEGATTGPEPSSPKTLG